MAVVAGLLGLAAGSFVTVLVARVPDRQHVLKPLARCPRCQRRLHAYELVPVVSWVASGGRCRGCGRAIGPRYVVLEVVTAAAFAALGARFGPTPVLVAYLYLAAVSVALAAVDIEHRRLPNLLTLPSYLVGLVLLALATLITGSGLAHLVFALVGMACMWAVYAVLFLISPASMGWGDVKLAGVLGLYLGWLGAGVWTVGIIAAFVLGGAYGLALIAVRKATRKTAIPFGPFMIIGALLAVLAGRPIAAAYLGL